MGERDVQELWSELVALRPHLTHVALSRLGDRDLADDVVAEALVRAASRSSEHIENLAAWTTRVVCNLCHDVHRGRHHGHNALRYWVSLSGSAPSPEDDECDRAVGRQVAAVVRGLPARQREAVELVASGCDVSAVATRLDVTYRCAESLLARARRAVRSVVAPSLVPVVAWLGRRTRATAVASVASVASVSLTLSLATVPPAPHAAPPAPRAPVTAAPAVRPSTADARAVARVERPATTRASVTVRASRARARTTAPPRGTSRPLLRVERVQRAVDGALDVVDGLLPVVVPVP